MEALIKCGADTSVRAKAALNLAAAMHDLGFGLAQPWPSRILLR